MMLYYVFLPWTLWRLKKEHPSLVLCKEILPFVPLTVSRLGMTTVIAANDWWWSIYFGGTTIGQKMAKWLESFEVRRWSRAGAYVIVNTEAEKRLVMGRGMRADHIHVINAPYRPGLFGPCDASEERKKLGFGEGLWTVAIHGIIRPGKGYGQLLEWWRDVTRVHANWRLLVIGGAGGESWFRGRMKRLGLEPYVVMTGWLPTKQDVNRHLNAADCLLVVRRNSEDNAGLIPSALNNSMATGKPTVATGLPGMAELVEHGKSGYLFEPDNYASFLAALEHVAAHPEEAKQVGVAGMKRAQECFDPDRAARMHVEMIDEILGRRSTETGAAAPSPRRE